MKYLLTIIITIMLSGCSGLGSTKAEFNNTKVQRSSIPDYLLIRCNPEFKPLSKEEYLKLSQPEREVYMTNYSISLLKTIKNCNIQLDEIRKLNSRSSNDNKP